MGFIKTCSYVVLAAILLAQVVKMRHAYLFFVACVVIYGGTKLGDLLPKLNIRDWLPFKLPEIKLDDAKKRVYPHRVYIEGPQASGKSYLIDQVDFAKIFGHSSIHIVPENVDQLALADFCDEEKQKTVAYTFNLLMAHYRQTQADLCKRDNTKTFLFDCSLIRSAVFHIVDYTWGILSQKHAQALFDLNLIAEACKPVRKDTEWTNAPNDVLIYCSADITVCAHRIIARGGADKNIKPQYHRLCVFVYAYVVLHIIERFPHMYFFLDTHRPPNGVANWDSYLTNKRTEVEKAAMGNLDIELTMAQRIRFLEAVSKLNKPAGFTWTEATKDTVRGTTDYLLAAERVVANNNRNAIPEDDETNSFE